MQENCLYLDLLHQILSGGVRIRGLPSGHRGQQQAGCLGGVEQLLGVHHVVQQLQEHAHAPLHRVLQQLPLQLLRICSIRPQAISDWFALAAQESYFP